LAGDAFPSFHDLTPRTSHSGQRPRYMMSGHPPQSRTGLAHARRVPELQKPLNYSTYARAFFVGLDPVGHRRRCAACERVSNLKNHTTDRTRKNASDVPAIPGVPFSPQVNKCAWSIPEYAARSVRTQLSLAIPALTQMESNRRHRSPPTSPSDSHLLRPQHARRRILAGELCGLSGSYIPFAAQTRTPIPTAIRGRRSKNATRARKTTPTNGKAPSMRSCNSATFCPRLGCARSEHTPARHDTGQTLRIVVG